MEMLKFHEVQYIERNTKKPRNFKVGQERYEAWADMWPHKGRVNITTLRWPESKVENFLVAPTQAGGKKEKTSYDWTHPISN